MKLPDDDAACAELVRLLSGPAAEKAARALKKIAEGDRTRLYGLRRELLREAMRAEDVRVQWNLTIVLGRLPMKGRDKALAVELMFERLQAEGSLNRTFAMQALVDLSEGDPGLRARVLPVVRAGAESGMAAMRARARRLLREIG